MQPVTWKYGILLLMGLLLGISCKSDPITQDAAVVPKKSVTIPAFNRDSAFAFVQQQVAFGPREMGSEAHEQCKEWIVDKLKAYGLEVEEQDFTAELFNGEHHPATNIIGRIGSGTRRKIVLAAHYDTRQMAEKDANPEKRDEPILGADDGASGVAVLLELARTLQANPIELDIDFVFFDAEDAGANGGGRDETWCLGSQYWSLNLGSSTKAQYGILLDMVGSKGATFPREGFSRQYAPDVVEKVWSLAQSMGYGHYFVNDQVPGLTDDHRFVNTIAGLPMIDIINYARGNFGSYHHTHNDNLDIIDRRTLGVVGQVVLATLFHEQAGTI